MTNVDLEACARVAEEASKAARAESDKRFRSVSVETKGDGSPVTEADRAAERAVRAVLGEAFPDHAILGEEFGGELLEDRPTWTIDPIDGTISYSRGIPLYASILALWVEGEPVVGLLDLPRVDERYVGWKGGGCWRNGQRVQASRCERFEDAVVGSGDFYCYEDKDEVAWRDALIREVPRLRTYTDAFGHGLVFGGDVDAMVDIGLATWDIAATLVLAPESGAACEVIDYGTDRKAVVIGSPTLVEQLLELRRETRA